MDFVNGINRDQLVMMDFEANVAVDAWACIVDLFEDMLPLEELGFKNVLSIFDINELKSRLKSLVCQLFAIFGSKRIFLSNFIFRIKNIAMEFFVNLSLAKRLILA